MTSMRSAKLLLRNFYLKISVLEICLGKIKDLWGARFSLSLASHCFKIK